MQLSRLHPFNFPLRNLSLLFALNGCDSPNLAPSALGPGLSRLALEVLQTGKVRNVCLRKSDIFAVPV